MLVSNCCGATPKGNGDNDTSDFNICPECWDHCEYIDEEDFIILEIEESNYLTDKTKFLLTELIQAGSERILKQIKDTLSRGIDPRHMHKEDQEVIRIINEFFSVA